MKYAIFTKYIEPTMSRGSGIGLCWTDPQGKANKDRVIWDYDLDVEANHAAAARELMEFLAQGSPVKLIVSLDACEKMTGWHRVHVFEVKSPWQAPMHKLIQKDSSHE